MSVLQASEINEMQCDLLIIGHSMAGGCLARQMHLEHPDMKITVIERKTEFGYWVGESTLEAFWNYAATSLDLGHYLDTNHLYKHGLRFFYDSEQHDLALKNMSEVGRSWYHGTPAHQIDRKKFDTDICNMNIKSGIDVRLGTTVTAVQLDRENGHSITTSDGSFRAKWVVDAAGFASPIARKLGISEIKNDEHPISSYWARVSGVANLDLLGGKEWRQRVRNTTRTLATTHFMYGGYWFWLIPLDAETYSIGMVTKNDECDIKIKGEEEFLAFLRTHKCMEELLPVDTAKILDYTQMKNLSRRVSAPFSEDRWFLTGMSAAFLDPLLSPGSAYLSDSNRMIGDMIKADMEGDEESYRVMVPVFNRFSQFWLDNFFMHIKGLYHSCYDRQKVYFTSMLMQWFGIILPSSMVKNWGYMPGMTMKDLPEFYQKMDYLSANNVIHKIDKIAHEFEDLLKSRGLEYTRNEGEFFDVEIDEQFMENTRSMGSTLTMDSIMHIEQKMLEITYHGILQRLSDLDKLNVTQEDLVMVSIESGQNELSVLESLKVLHTKNKNSHKTLKTSEAVA
ncbi:MAG: FADH2 O2-dependent halogenase [Oceanicoccus sp.]|jgi:FADH2 O2-dependent halogenase